MEYGLIGARLGHSYSQPIHNALADYDYRLCELPTESDLHRFMQKKEFKGINVTIPYKELVMPYCDTIDNVAQAIGSVNTIVNRGGILEGHNTDFAGFVYLLRKNGIELNGKKVMILGTGGTQKTASAVARSEQAAEIVLVSRQQKPGVISYEQAKSRRDIQVIINTTPVGMFPENAQSLLCPEEFPKLYAAIDVIYNPLKTDFLLRASQCGAKTANGLSMLVAQAKYAAEYFAGHRIEDAEIARIEAGMRKDVANLVLVGMPSCGKTTIGAYCAKIMNRAFLDLDAEIEKESKKTISEIFSAEGEAGFRAKEKAILKKAVCGHAQVIATGGGAVLDAENIQRMHQNSVVIWLQRPTEKLEIGGVRPLSSSYEALCAMEKKRRPLYQAAGDAYVVNDSTPEKAAQAVVEAFYEILDH